MVEVDKVQENQRKKEVEESSLELTCSILMMFLKIHVEIHVEKCKKLSKKTFDVDLNFVFIWKESVAKQKNAVRKSMVVILTMISANFSAGSGHVPNF